jgi:WD40 repeat protein
MRLVDLSNGKEIRRWSCPSYPIPAAAFSPDSKTIAAAGSNGAILFWDALSGQPEAAFVGHQGGIESLALSPDGKFLASVAADGGIMFWNLATARPLPGFHSPKEYFNNVAISPDGQWLAAGIQFRQGVRLLKTLTGEEVRRFTGCANGEHVLTFSPDGKMLAAGSTDNSDNHRDKSIRLWETATGKLLRRIVFPLPARPTGGIVCLAFSPDGRFLASGCAGGDVHIWSAANGELYCRLPDHEFWVSSLCFSPDRQTLATTGPERAKKVIRLWEVRSGKERGQLAVPTDRDVSLTFSPYGRLASAGGDKTIRIWDLDSGEELGCFRGHQSTAGPLAFSSDGQRLISGSRDTTILVWDMKTIPQPGRTKAVELSPKELEAHWADLADADASKAFTAIRALIRTRQQSVSFIMEHLRQVPPIAAEKMIAWIAELDSERFETRAKAEEELKELRELAETSLRQAVQDKRTSLEQRRRLEGLLQRLQGPITSGETLRQLRAVEVLEHIGSPEAQQVLQTLTAGAPQAVLTREAKAALERLMHKSNTAR